MSLLHTAATESAQWDPTFTFGFGIIVGIVAIWFLYHDPSWRECARCSESASFDADTCNRCGHDEFTGTQRARLIDRLAGNREGDSR